MSDGPTSDRLGEALWVVDVTAPLAPGRVRVVAGEAAARLNLPAEKFVALLENRIGPVTKPLPEASARRVAEVLDLAGAEVTVRRTDAAPAEPSDQREDAPAAEPAETEPAAADDAPVRAAEHDEPTVQEKQDRSEGETPIGREGRASAPAQPDPWRGLEDEDDGDEAMLGTWRRSEVDAAPQEPTRVPLADRPPARNDEVWASPEEDLGDEAWSYGMRDPFAEAERRERAVRRWVLVGALLVASTIFVALQLAYSRPGPDDRTPASYQQGLQAYRDGAFVTAARRWTSRAEAGDATAMFMLGWMAEFGQGRPWSNAEAASWYRQAAQRGHAPSQLRLADLYDRGLGVAHDPDQARRWYRAAAEAGLPRAQREAALASAQQGRWAEARGWLERAAPADPDAAAWLGLIEASETGYEGSR